MAGAPGSRWTERWGEIVVLLAVWVTLSAVVLGAAQISVIRHAWNVRSAGGVAIGAALAEGDGAVVRVRGVPVAGLVATQLTDDTGTLTMPGRYVGSAADARVEAVGCLRAGALEPCHDAPLLAGAPAALRAAETALYRRAAAALAVVLAALIAAAYLAGRMLGAPLGRRIARQPTAKEPA